ncbi:murein L,D-transpeptidase family protein [Fodinicurvata halophila]|uniref:Murein L,D-transpeptidase family protein n=2 Tax=Fodinicurvata halophila TaxID=1419723 RepID=A0ABV8UGT2_9PROT
MVRRCLMLAGIVLWLLPGLAAGQGETAGQNDPKTRQMAALEAGVDYIEVRKGERVLELYRDGEVLASYPIQLGKRPEGPKRFEGDKRTPEGTYRIGWRNPESSFFLSLGITYPNEEDKAYAERYGVSAGGQIMLHGMPNDTEYRKEVFNEPNWTNGCIALRDHHMLEIWRAVEVGTPIRIKP